MSQDGRPPGDDDTGVSKDEHVARIRAAYAHYDATSSEQRKRDPANPGNTAIGREQSIRFVVALDTTFPEGLQSVRALDVGCGRADFLNWLRDRGARVANLHGVDVLEDRIAAAHQLHPELDLRCLDARHLPFADSSFDLVICRTIFSSILESGAARAVAEEIQRVLAPHGVVGWYDVRLPNPANSQTIAMTRGRIRRLFPDLRCDLQSLTLLPPLARRLGPLTDAAYRPLAALPFLRSHYLGMLRRA